MGKEFYKVITRAKALSLFSSIPLTRIETVPVREGVGRISGSTLRSPCDVPGFDRSTMDGYAVVAEDTFSATETNLVSLKITGEVLMGKEPDRGIERGEVLIIPTGGMLPQGADAVVMQEYAEREGGSIKVKRAVAPRENVTIAGSDVKMNEVLLEEGNLIRSQDIGAIAACGITEMDVFSKPRIAIISTGDELVPPQRTPGPGQIRSINSYTLATLAERYGCHPLELGITKDRVDELKGLIESGIQNSDLLVISGGSSVGTKDRTLESISSVAGAEILANGLALKPGKPTIIAQIDGTPVIGLPGHPVSCMVIFFLIVRPLVHRMVSYRERVGEEGVITAFMRRNISSVSGREEYIRVQLKKEGEKIWALPVPGGSSIISSLSRADGLVRIDREREGVDEGESVDVVIL